MFDFVIARGSYSDEFYEGHSGKKNFNFNAAVAHQKIKEVCNLYYKVTSELLNINMRVMKAFLIENKPVKNKFCFANRI